ncbi:MAG: RNA pseudouridine synthase [Planctomycetales bacterium]|nr:RNA pseudouridine synthase [Planctomycetales bacterium]
MSLGFDILHEDADCLVVAKPGGLLTQAPLGIDSLEVRIKKFLRERDAIEGDVYLGVPHRLDRPVSGVLVFAKHRKAARKISNQFEQRRVEKTYWALVQGDVQPASGTWVDYLKKVEGDPRSVVTDANDPEGQNAILHYKVVKRMKALDPHPGPLPGGEGVGVTLLEIKLETGRTHQIRIQCASRGHALLGDEMYRSPHHFGPPTDDERQRMVALHARSLAFWNPVSRAVMTYVAPLPEYWPNVEGGEK